MNTKLSDTFAACAAFSLLTAAASAQKIQWNDASPTFGARLAVVADLNGGGRRDIVAGNPAAGSVAVLLSETGTRLTTITGTPGFGESLALLPDLDGDGMAEFAVGDPALGRVVVYGMTAGQLQTRFVLTGGTGFGSALALIGNQSGSGVPELAVGTPGANTGSVQIFDLNTRTVVTTIAGGTIGDFGRRLAFIWRDSVGGDYLAVGAPGRDVGSVQDCGYAALYRIVGGAATQVWGFTFNQLFANQRFGDSIAASADVDGNGAPDVAIGHPQVPTAMGTSNVSIWGLAPGQVLATYPGADMGRQLAACADAQGDGRPELITTDGRSLFILEPKVGATTIPLITSKGSTQLYSGGLATGDVFQNGSVTIVAGLNGRVELENFGAVTRTGSRCSSSIYGAANLALQARAVGDYYRPVTSAAPGAMRLLVQNDNFGPTLPFVLYYNAAPQPVLPFGACEILVGSAPITFTSGSVAPRSESSVVVPIPANSPNLVYGGIVWQVATLAPCAAGSCIDLSNGLVSQVGDY